VSSTLYSAHQPDLLPYSGFWYKMAKADVFDLKVWDQFAAKGYQRRVKMRDQWVTLPLERSSDTDPIFSKRLKPEAVGFLVDEIVKRYTHSRRKPLMWDKYGEMICDEILTIKTDALWNLNFQLILLVRDVLGIRTPVTFSRPASPGLRGSAGIIDVIQNFSGPMEYLSGQGGRSYMGDCREFKEAGIPVVWSQHQAVTGDSILSVIFDHEDPMSVVLAESNETHPKE
jgi:hypothetical protein